MRFFAMDDEPTMLKGLVSVLNEARPEAEILSFQWPEDALEAAGHKPPDVAFLDIQMGEMTGLQLAVQLKQIKPDIHIIFVTGFSQYAVDAFAMHATGYLLKPAEREDVERELTFIYGTSGLKSRIQVKMFGGFDLFCGRRAGLV
jgi:two-component SAPR family response regulator